MNSPNKLSPDQLCDNFYAWQCRIRQIAMREAEGRPSPAMRPALFDASGESLSDGVITLLVRNSPEESTDFFRFQVQKSHDPKEVREKTLRYLQSTYYHGPSQFSDQLTALFAPNSSLADHLVKTDKCVLKFHEFSQGYELVCDVEKLTLGDRFHSATLWHNRNFNPNTSDDVQILSFKPDWNVSKAV